MNLPIASQREAAKRLAAFVLATRGHGDSDQRAAYEELEWRLCSRSLEYFVEHYGYLKMKGAPPKRWGPNMWPRQHLFLRRLDSDEDMVIYKTRQIAVTTAILHAYLQRCMFRTGWSGTFMSDTLVKAKEARSRIDVTWTFLPEWMKRRAHIASVAADTRSEDARANVKTPKRRQQEGVEVFATGLSMFRIVSSTETQVQGIIGDVCFDEFENHKDQMTKLHLVDAAVGEVDGEKGQLIVLGNGKGMDGLYTLWSQASAGKVAMSAMFFGYNFNPTHSKAWRKRKLAEAVAKDPEYGLVAFNAQHPASPNMCWGIAASSTFSPKALARIRANAEEIARTAQELGEWPIRGRLMRDHGGPCEERYEWASNAMRFAFDPYQGNLWVYEPPLPGERYVVWGDPAGVGPTNSKSSNAAMQVLRVTDDNQLIQAARSRTRLAPDLFANLLMDTATAYNQALLGYFRANEMGGRVAEVIKSRGYGPLYREKRGMHTLGNEPEAGFLETRASSKHLIEILRERLHHNEMLLYDLATIEELEHLDTLDNGTTEPQPGHKDDLALSLAGGCVGSEVLPAKVLAARPQVSIDPFTGEQRYGPSSDGFTW